MALTDSTDDNLPVLEPSLVYLSCGLLVLVSFDHTARADKVRRGLSNSRLGRDSGPS